jgi:hypothetical protein
MQYASITESKSESPSLVSTKLKTKLSNDLFFNKNFLHLV